MAPQDGVDHAAARRWPHLIARRGRDATSRVTLIGARRLASTTWSRWRDELGLDDVVRLHRTHPRRRRPGDPVDRRRLRGAGSEEPAQRRLDHEQGRSSTWRWAGRWSPSTCARRASRPATAALYATRQRRAASSPGWSAELLDDPARREPGWARSARERVEDRALVAALPRAPAGRLRRSPRPPAAPRRADAPDAGPDPPGLNPGGSGGRLAAADLRRHRIVLVRAGRRVETGGDVERAPTRPVRWWPARSRPSGRSARSTRTRSRGRRRRTCPALPRPLRCRAPARPGGPA